MYTLIAFATNWGSKHGGINSFNTDFLTAFGVAYHLNAQVICIVPSAPAEIVEDALKAHVRLVPLPYIPQSVSLQREHGRAGVDELKRLDVDFDPDRTVWLGHDRITGHAAIGAAKIAGGRAAVIHHMSYDHYEAYAEDSQSAQKKTNDQSALLRESDIVLAVGPLLRDTANDLISKSKPVHTLIPGLAEIEPQDAPNTFVAFLAGRLTDDASRIKQGQLGIAAFATAQKEARDEGRPDALCKQPKLLVRGVDFESQLAESPFGAQEEPETELRKFADEYGQAIVNLHALPFTNDRKQLYSELSRSTVALMPSWHEGFGLVAWEAIAAGVPLILSKNNGVYRLLDEEYPGAGTGSVYPLDIRGAVAAPYFRQDDLQATVAALKDVADNPRKARKQASILKNMLEDRTWSACGEQAVRAFDWNLERGSISSVRTPGLPQTSTATTPGPTDQAGPLRMPAGQWGSVDGMAESQLLRAEEDLLPFDPRRRPDVEKLNIWLDDPQWPLAVRLITGPGGQGKTRLALELCKERLAAGWHTGFLDTALEPGKMTATWQVLSRLSQPVLIVIDYAETRQTTLLALLRAALERPANQAVRILLLARDGGEWWDNLASKDPQCEALLSAYATTGPFRLPALYSAEVDRREGYRKALLAFAQALRAPAPDTVPDLLAEHFERPLYVQIAALLALYGERPTTAQGLTKALLNHERRYWKGVLASSNWHEPERRAEQLLALTTLGGGFATPKNAQSYWSRAKGGVLSTADFNYLFRALTTLYPGTQGLGPMRPDLLGESLVAQALLRSDGGTLLNAVLSSSASQSIRRNALTVLARLSVQRPDLDEILVDALSRDFASCCREMVAVSKETNGRLPALAELAFKRLPPPVKSQASGLLTPLLLEESVQLGDLSCVVSEYQAEKSRERFEKKPGDQDRMAGYAAALRNYALDLNRVGRFNLASDVGLISLELYRALVDKDVTRFKPDYAASLNTYAWSLTEAGQNEEAVEHAREALEIRKLLAQKSPDRFEPAYAASLSNYAAILREAGHDEEALEHDRGALEMRKRLSQEDPDRFEPDYAGSLGNYAGDLWRAGHTEEALQHAREAFEIWERLAQKNPDRFEPDYARSLSHYSIALSDVGCYDEAAEHARQDLRIWERLAQKNPDRFESDYATSLTNYAILLANAGHTDKALEHVREIWAIQMRLAEKDARRSARDLLNTQSLTNLLAWLSYRDDQSDKTDLNEEAKPIPEHHRAHLLFYSAFVEGCLAQHRTERAEAFARVLSYWPQLSVGDKTRSQACWLCAAAWCAKFQPADVQDTGWEANWRQYRNQRKGRVPHWVLEVARRLDFEWPND